jgi:hypothetical protein
LGHRARKGNAKIPRSETRLKKSSPVRAFAWDVADAESSGESKRSEEEAPMSHALHPVLQVLIALSFLAVLILPNVFAKDVDFDADDRNQNHIP